ncbi:MAG: metallophosphoesterase [Proteobacteria bacterium]|nr:metallophosphoesterase [Pseudomonadota bacterium]MBU2226850.1 metallophosphoesterase [Pseudomonadota bacterium]MBU2261728.1 metallophosphoesterase [Pseudomonadota bacterium]
MRLFLLTFFLIYGGFHFHFFLRFRAAFAPGAAVQAVLVVLLLLGLMAPIIVRVSERYDLEALARLMSWIGYLWMAVLLLFIASSVLLEIYRLLVRATGMLISAEALRFLPSAGILFFIPVAAALAIVGYGFFAALEPRVERLEIRSAKIPKETGRIRVVQISDVHVGLLVRGERLALMLRKVREAAPDVLVCTGDLVDGQGDNLAEAAAQFREINPPLGKFAVTGNHEFYAGIDQSLDFIAKSGFIILRGEVATVAGVIDLAGVDDPAIRLFSLYRKLSDRGVISRGGGSGRFTILLKHQPLLEEDAPGAFDLQLSGHTHKGQIFPFSLVTRLVFPYHSGSFPLANGALLHVSGGMGTWGPPVRFLSPPEITVIDIGPE